MFEGDCHICSGDHGPRIPSVLRVLVLCLEQSRKVMRCAGRKAVAAAAARSLIKAIVHRKHFGRTNVKPPSRPRPGTLITAGPLLRNRQWEVGLPKKGCVGAAFFWSCIMSAAEQMQSPLPPFSLVLWCRWNGTYRSLLDVHIASCTGADHSCLSVAIVF